VNLVSNPVRRDGSRRLPHTMLFRKLDYPGAPTHFVDPRSVEEILESGDLGEELTTLLKERRDLDDVE